MTSFLWGIFVGAVGFEIFMKYRAKKIYQFSLTDEGRFMTLGRMRELQMKFWRPIR